MNHKLYILFSLIFLFFCSALYGYTVSSVRKPIKSPRVSEQENIIPEVFSGDSSDVTSLQSEGADTEEYKICIRNNHIQMYEIKKGNERLIETSLLPPSALPQEDIRQLKVGITFQTKPEADKVMEDFAE